MIEYYGRDIGVKIMPTGVNPDRFLNGFTLDDTLWRRSELLSQVCNHAENCLEHAISADASAALALQQTCKEQLTCIAHGAFIAAACRSEQS